MEFRHRREYDWRFGERKNQAVFRYHREIVLKMFKASEKPWIGNQENIEKVLLDVPCEPLLSEFFPFVQPLIEEVNSRKVKRRETQLFPQWYQVCDKKIQIPLKNYTVKNGMDDAFIQEKQDISLGFKESIEMEHQRNDGKIEKALKVPFCGKNIDFLANEEERLEKRTEDEKGKEFDRFNTDQLNRPQRSLKKSAAKSYVTCRVYDMNLLRYQLTIGNPFARFLIQVAINKDDQTATFDVGSKAFEKVWFYKDLENVEHGPFSSLEMFSWTARNCFPSDLQIALTPDMSFMPMYNYNFLESFF